MLRKGNNMLEKLSPRDWAEDSDLENGNYMCPCEVCKRPFIGYKRRTICKVCSDFLKIETINPETEIQKLSEQWFDHAKLGPGVTPASLLYFGKNVAEIATKPLVEALKKFEGDRARYVASLQKIQDILNE